MLHELILTLYHLLPFLATLAITAAALVPISNWIVDRVRG